MGGQTVGYIRVSSPTQNPARQLEGLARDCDFTDTITGAAVQRPALQEMIAYVRKGDIVLVHSMDRLARSLIDLVSIVQRLRGKGVAVRFVREGMTFNDSEDPTSWLLLHVMGAVAQFERELIRERQAEGVALAKARKAFKGGQWRFTENVYEAAAQRVEMGWSIPSSAKAAGMSRFTLWRFMQMRRGPAGRAIAFPVLKAAKPDQRLCRHEWDDKGNPEAYCVKCGLFVPGDEG